VIFAHIQEKWDALCSNEPLLLQYELNYSINLNNYNKFLNSSISNLTLRLFDFHNTVHRTVTMPLKLSRILVSTPPPVGFKYNFQDITIRMLLLLPFKAPLERSMAFILCALVVISVEAESLPGYGSLLNP